MNLPVAALALSLAVNAVLGLAYLDKRDDVATLTVERDSARGDASACSDAVQDLREQATKRQAENDKLRAAARAAAKQRQTRAQELLSRPPAVPGDSCKSSQVFIDDWLGSRTK